MHDDPRSAMGPRSARRRRNRPAAPFTDDDRIMTSARNQLAALAAAIERVAASTRRPTLLTAFFREHREMGQQDRAFIADGVFAYLRRKRSLEALAETDDPRKLALAVARARARRSACAISSRCAERRATRYGSRAFKARLRRRRSPGGRRRPARLAVGRASARRSATTSATRSRARGSRRRRSTCASIR